MTDEYTANYNFFLPKSEDSMADVVKNLTTSFNTLEPRGDPTIISAGGALPQAGSYVLGDRVFRADAVSSTTYPSSYILVCKDVNWGWHWRPVQHIISPWVTLTANIWETADFELNPTHPLQIALDSRGYCHWRGSFRRPTPGIPQLTTIEPFKEIPLGIRPNVRFMKTLAVSPVVSTTGINGYSGGRIFMNNIGGSSVRFWRTDNGTSQDVWVTGLEYNNSNDFYYSG